MRKLLISAALGLSLVAGLAAAQTTHKQLYLYVNVAEKGSELFYNTGWVITANRADVTRTAEEARAKNLPASKGFVRKTTLNIQVGQKLIDQVS